eukprot:11262613-Alexandrium_andersonii.AAC.1
MPRGISARFCFRRLRCAACAVGHTLPHLFHHLAIRSNTGPGLKVQPGRSRATMPVSYTHLTLPTICSV